MLVEAQKLIKLSVASMDALARVGEVREVLVDPDNGRILGFLVKMDGFFAPQKVLSIVDIKEWDPNGLITESLDNLVDKEEIIRIKEILQEGIYILGSKAITESNKNLGTVENFLIDTENETVVKYYLRDLFGKARVFPADKVCKIEKGKIIFSDDTAEIPGEVIGTQTV